MPLREWLVQLVATGQPDERQKAQNLLNDIQLSIDEPLDLDEG